MPPKDNNGFVKDSADDLTTEEKNRELAAKLETRPWVRRKLVRVERVEIGGKGWRVIYRTSTR